MDRGRIQWHGQCRADTFGDWMEAVKSAGLAPLGPGWRSAQAIKWSREEIVRQLRNPPAQVNDPRNSRHWKNAGRGGMVTAAINMGGWHNMLRSAGYEPILTVKKPAWQEKKRIGRR